MNLPHSSPLLFQVKKEKEDTRWVEGTIISDDTNPYWGSSFILIEVMAQGAVILLEGEGGGFVANWKHVRVKKIPGASLIRLRIRLIKRLGNLVEFFAEAISENKRIGRGILIIKKYER